MQYDSGEVSAEACSTGLSIAASVCGERVQRAPARPAGHLAFGPDRSLRALERAEIVARRLGPKGRTLEYRLTPAGRDMEAVVQAIGEWGLPGPLPIPVPMSSTPTS